MNGRSRKSVRRALMGVGVMKHREQDLMNRFSSYPVPNADTDVIRTGSQEPRAGSLLILAEVSR
jgi:hypothetical protein